MVLPVEISLQEKLDVLPDDRVLQKPQHIVNCMVLSPLSVLLFVALVPFRRLLDGSLRPFREELLGRQEDLTNRIDVLVVLAADRAVKARYLLVAEFREPGATHGGFPHFFELFV